MINLFYEDHDAEWQAWIDVEDLPKDGVCLGSGSTKTEALFKASLQLQHELSVIRELMCNNENAAPPGYFTEEAKLVPWKNCE